LRDLGPMLASLDIRVVATSSLDRAIERGAELGDFAVRLFVEDSRSDLLLNFWREGERTQASMEVGTTFTYYEKGKLLHDFLIAAAPVYGCEALALGLAYDDQMFAPLDTRMLVERIQSGKVFETVFPCIHLLHHRLLSPAVFQKLMQNPPLGRWRYELSASGYHVLYEL
jgi:hypothetical protein